MIVTPWISADKLGGSCRVFSAEVMGYNNDANGHKLYLAPAYNFDKLFGTASDKDISALSTRSEQYDGASTGSANSAHLVRYDFRGTRATAFRVKIYDAAPSGGSKNQGPDISAVVFEVRPLKQSHKIDRGRKANV